MSCLCPADTVTVEDLCLLTGARLISGQGQGKVVVTGVTYDSRQVQSGDLFVAVPGFEADGRRFIAPAIAKGAVAVLGKSLAGFTSTGAVLLEVDDVREAMAKAACAVYGYPGRELTLFGITGTNGKTTTAYLLRSILEKAGKKSGLLGTVEYITGPAAQTAARTTPESPDIQRYLRLMCEHGMKAAVMEVSSHALALKRLEGCFFSVGIFTNLSPDHLDFHHSMEDYFQAKRSLFDRYLGEGSAIVNLDDPYGARLAASLKGPVFTYGLNPRATVRAEDLEGTDMGLRFRLCHPGGAFQVESRLVGRYNVSNLLAAGAAALAIGISSQIISEGLMEMTHVPGRLESVDAGQKYRVFVDYAHTEDALERAIEASRSVATTGRLITVFGCGGDRDRAKRPRMGSVATWGSDYVIVTTDNPRREDPKQIFSDIRSGISRFNYLVIPDRRRAIRHAVMMASEGDVVLIAGKGHESYQEVAGERYPFNDREEALAAIKEKNHHDDRGA